jgi:hypothetical protein
MTNPRSGATRRHRVVRPGPAADSAARSVPGQHYIAGIGFQGGMRKVAGRPISRTSAAVRQGPGPEGRGGAGVLLDFYIAEGATGHAFWASVPFERLRALIADLEKLADADAVERALTRVR